MSRHQLRAPRRTFDSPTAPSPLAMRIALAYYIERCVEDGTLKSYAEAASRLGISRARMSHVVDLILLSADHQERILAVAIESDC